MTSTRSVFILVGPEDQQRLGDIDKGLAPRLDYRLVASELGACIKICAPAPTALRGHKFGRLQSSFRANFHHAVQLIKHIPDDSIIYSTGETWGLPTALALRLLNRPCVHVIYVHRVYSTAWRRLLQSFNGLLQIDGWICATRQQAAYLRENVVPRAESVYNVTQGVDTDFFDPARAAAVQRSSYVLAVGLEMRDYDMLFDAVRELNVEVIVKASSNWMATKRQRIKKVPSNVKIMNDRLSYVELRELYARSSFVVAPLYDTLQAAGISTILEAMAMQKCVVATRSQGLPDILVNGETGLIVQPDHNRFREAIRFLLDTQQTRETLAQTGHLAVSQSANIEHHAERVSDFLRATAERRLER